MSLFGVLGMSYFVCKFNLNTNRWDATVLTIIEILFSFSTQCGYSLRLFKTTFLGPAEIPYVKTHLFDSYFLHLKDLALYNWPGFHSVLFFQGFARKWRSFQGWSYCGCSMLQSLRVWTPEVRGLFLGKEILYLHGHLGPYLKVVSPG